MLPSSLVNTNPFEVPPDPSRSATPTPAPTSPPTPSPDASTSALPRIPSSHLALDASQPTSDQLSTKPPSRSLSSTFAPSPLNPNAAPYPIPRPNRPLSTNRGSVYLNRIASEDSQALGSQQATQRASMVLWRLATDDDQGDLIPPRPLGPDHRASVVSSISGESIWSLSSDSKYPSAPPTTRGSLVAYAWDPLLDDNTPDDDDILHQPDAVDKRPSVLNPRGILNVGVLILLLVGLLGLFIALPVVVYVHDNSNALFIAESAGGNTITAASNSSSPDSG